MIYLGRPEIGNSNNNNINSNNGMMGSLNKKIMNFDFGNNNNANNCQQVAISYPNFFANNNNTNTHNNIKDNNNTMGSYKNIINLILEITIIIIRIIVNKWL